MTDVELPLGDILSSPHAINVHESAEAVQNYIACGDIGGRVIDGELAIGLRERNGSGHHGVAVLKGKDAATGVSVYLTEEGSGPRRSRARPMIRLLPQPTLLPGGGRGNSAPATAAPAETPADAAGVRRLPPPLKFRSISAISLSARIRSKSRSATRLPGRTRIKSLTRLPARIAMCCSPGQSRREQVSVRCLPRQESSGISVSSIPTCREQSSSIRRKRRHRQKGKESSGRKSRRRAVKTSRAGVTTLALCLASLTGLFLGGSGGQAQEASPPRPSHIHVGDCDEPGEVIQPLTSLTVPTGDVSGNSDAVVAEAAFTSIPQSLDELLAEDHALKVHLSKEQIQTYIAVATSRSGRCRWRTDRRHARARRLRIRRDRVSGAGRQRYDERFGDDRPGRARRDRRGCL